MSKPYDFLKFEPQWRDTWEKEGQHTVLEKDPRPKYYCLDMFPYPSGSGLHVGHWRGYVLSDVWSRYQTLLGHKVLHPMGWDAFGLPAENDAIKKKTHPKHNTQKNIENIKRQLKEIGAMYNWDREVNTTDPKFYKWTQWIFLKMVEKGLAYRKEMPINWCPSCKVGLANEEVVGGKCERCDSEVSKRNLKQWMLKITHYADRLLEDLKDLNWPEKVKAMQANWIGKSEGAEVVFEIEGAQNQKHSITVFTTRPDTLCGATFMVLAPEHPLVLNVCHPNQKKEVQAYIEEASKLKEMDRTSTELPVSGVSLGVFAINPVNGAKMPVWISDYVLMDYGTGAIMCVPAHDERDHRFAKKYGLDIQPVILGCHPEEPRRGDEGSLSEAYTGEGILINSGIYNGLDSKVAKKKITEDLSKKGLAKEKTHYKLRDWVFSRQRYWGEPIPIIYCQKCGEMPLREEDLPIELPEVKTYEPSGTGESPLAKISEWVETKCYKCGSPAKRETDNMPQGARSSWYFLRSPSPDYNQGPFDLKSVKHWMPVDMYVGGVEHAVLHLLYARFFSKFLYDLKLIDFKEPFQRLFNQGMVCRRSEKTGKIEKMSKSKLNVVNPDELVQKYGTDTVRLFELFIGPPELDAEWSDNGIEGVHKFLKRAWAWVQASKEKASQHTDPEILRHLHDLIKKVTERLEGFKFNVIVSAFMEFMNEVSHPKNETKAIDQKTLETFLVLLSPLAPHLCEEAWHDLGHKDSIFKAHWPTYDPKFLETQTMAIVVQVNGKLRANLEVDKTASPEDIKVKAKADARIQKHLEGKTLVKEIYVPGRLLNFVVQ